MRPREEVTGGSNGGDRPMETQTVADLMDHGKLRWLSFEFNFKNDLRGQDWDKEGLKGRGWY